MDKKMVLLVEGASDKGVVEALFHFYRQSLPVEYLGFRGKDDQKRICEQILKNPTAYCAVGVVTDADSNAESRWHRYRDLLLKTGRYDCSNIKLSYDGIIVEPADRELDPRFGLWVMPDNQRKGTLEDFLLEMVLVMMN